MPKFLNRFKTVLSQDIDPSFVSPSVFAKTRFAMLGTVGSGKTTIAGALLLTAQTLSADNPEFYCRVLEYTSGIREAASNLRRGRFPPKTTPYTTYAHESGLLMKWSGWIGQKKVQIPICDIAGEISDRIDPYNPGLDPLKERAAHINQYMIRRIRDSQDFIVALPANEALMLKDSSSRIDTYIDINCTQQIRYFISKRISNHISCRI